MEKTKWISTGNTVFEDENFKQVDFSKSSLVEYTFTGCLFEGCTFMESDWKKASFLSCVFNGCDIGLVSLEDARFQDVRFVDCKVTGMEFFKCDHSLLFSMELNSCFLQYCNFSDLNMNKTNFKKSKIQKCFFTNTSLMESDFGDCDLLETVFHSCNLRKANFGGAKNYNINPLVNDVKKAKFSFPEAVSLLKGLDVKIL